ncbi:MAG: DUF2318 domain-containing protein [Desulfuromonadales bacterium]|nr:DUF2318 domain-containing protein [Desulfuromonadales bacterium]
MRKANPVIIKWTGFIIIAVLFGVGSVFAFNFPGFGNSDVVKPVNGEVSIMAAPVADGKAHHYRYVTDGKEIKFFVVKGTDGAFHVAFDACDVCFQEKKGYFQEGDFMICRNCNQKFATNKIGRTGGGGCNPSQLNFAQNGANIVIQASELAAGGRFF